MTQLDGLLASPRRMVAFGLALVLIVAGALIARGERRLATGRTAFLAIADAHPAPRSPLQGDGIALSYEVAAAAAKARDQALEAWPNTGYLVVGLDDRGVATFRRRHEDGAELAADEALLAYRWNVYEGGSSQLAIGAGVWRHQEGEADTYAGARYAEYRLTPDGVAVLVALRGADLAVLGRPRGRW